VWCDHDGEDGDDDGPRHHPAGVAHLTAHSAVASEDFSQVTGAPATILSATLVMPAAGSSTTYPYCDVKGMVAPQVQFELQLPTNTYARRYLQEGCGGYCGNVGVSQPAASGQAGVDECVPLNNGEFALGRDDEGHIGGGNTEAWAVDDPMLKVDFGYLSEHVFALADFNGIIAGAPAFNQAALNAMEEPYESKADETSSGQPILTAAQSAVLHNDIISQCADPGLRDGTIQDPRDCQPEVRHRAVADPAGDHRLLR
jgi:feruloyl esterase